MEERKEISGMVKMQYPCSQKSQVFSS
jgi:hypothetical protein